MISPKNGPGLALPEKSAKIEICQQSKLSVRANSADTHTVNAGKTHNRRYRGGLDFFETQFVLFAAKGNFRDKKVEAPLKNLEKSPIMCFASLQKITSQTIRISRTLLFLCTGVTI